MKDEFRGVRVLIVEDDFLAAERVRRLLDELGCEVVGMAPTPAQAMDLANERDPVVAVLDVQLGAETVFGLAKTLAERSVSLMFVTSTPPSEIPPPLRRYPFLAKPYTNRDFSRSLELAIS